MTALTLRDKSGGAAAVGGGGAAGGGDGIAAATDEDAAICADLVGTDGFVISEEAVAQVAALVPQLFPIRPVDPPVPPNPFSPLELDPQYKGAGVTIDQANPLKLVGSGGSNYQPVLAKKGFLVTASKRAVTYFEVRLHTSLIYWTPCRHFIDDCY